MSIFDETPPFLPVDRVARRVAGKGDHWEPVPTRNARPHQKTFDAPPLGDPRPPQQKDYAGVRRGKMVAFHYFGRRSRKGGDRVWVVRCDCGLYEFRRINKFLNHFNASDCCSRCDEAHFVRTGEYLSRKRGDNYTEVTPMEPSGNE